MNTPDKIYIQPNAYDGWFEGNKPNDNFVEYIHKDALLEWAKEKEDFALTKAVKLAYKTMIDKINSM